MKERAREVKGQGDGAAAVLARIAQMKEPDRGLARRVHEIITANAPELAPRLWYGMPAWAKDDKVVCHFQDAQKFKTRYSSLGFSDKANLDDGNVFPVAFAVKALGPAEETRLAALVKKAIS